MSLGQDHRVFIFMTAGPEDGGTTIFRNFGKYALKAAASRSRRLEYSDVNDDCADR